MRTEPRESPDVIRDELPPDSEPELLREFASQMREHLQAAEESLLSLEARPEELESAHTCMRALHTIKGTAGCLGLKAVAELSHALESLLSKLQGRETSCTHRHATLALRALDMLKGLVKGIEEAAGGKTLLRPRDYPEMLATLANPDERRAETRAAPRQAEHPAKVEPKRPIESSMRVRTERLDRLIDMVGELVISHSMVSQDPGMLASGEVDLQRKIHRTAKIVRELQDLTMVLRMLPLRGTFQTLTRLVRDLAQRSGKEIQLVAEGEDTEIDRSMVDIIDVPLVHMVRNAVDHGLEAPEERDAAGKPPGGTLRLSAYRAGGSVVIEVADDGRGLDREKILKTARARGLVPLDRDLSVDEAHALIFTPGFSTADKVTDVSGRGVGMDVVKKNVEALRGRIEIISTPGSGCLFRLCLPLTLAVTDGMLVRVGAERYIIPTVDISMSLKPETGLLSTVAGRGELISLRGALIPIIRLHVLFGLEGAGEQLEDGLLVIAKEGARQCAIFVDEILGQHQVVAKSLGEGLGRVPGVSGAAILGDGRVGLILDVAEVASLSRQDGGGSVQRWKVLESVA